MIYSINRDLPQHPRARAWWERVLSGTTIVGLPWVVLQSGTGGNLVTDAHIAALALETGSDIHSADNDFRRFAGVRHVNPLEA